MTQTTLTRLKQAGFNLIEAAIVLGVIGLVVGGIWVAASTVLARQHAQVATLFLQDVEAITRGHQNEFIASGSTSFDINNLIVAKNILPSGITAIPETGSHVFGGSGIFFYFTATIVTPPRQVLLISEFYFFPTLAAVLAYSGPVPKPVTCVQLVQDILRRNPAPGPQFQLVLQSELTSLLIYAPPLGTRPTPQQIATACAETVYIFLAAPV